MVEEAIGMKDRKKIYKAALLAVFCLLSGILYSCRPKEEAGWESVPGALEGDKTVQSSESSSAELQETADPLQGGKQNHRSRFKCSSTSVARWSVQGVYTVDADTKDIRGD